MVSPSLSYRLRLGNGQEWQIIAAGRWRGFAERLASIMQLQAREGNRAPRFILKQREAGDRAGSAQTGELATSVAADLPTRGWRVHAPFSHLPALSGYLPSLRVFFHDQVRDVIFEIGEVEKCDAATAGDHGTRMRTLPKPIPVPESVRRLRQEGFRRRLVELNILSPAREAVRRGRQEAFRRRAAELTILREVVRTIEDQVRDSGGLPLHSAIAAWNGRGVLLLGHSESGKSTCCRRLPPSWQAMGDDEAVAVRSECGCYVGHAFPTWSNLRSRDDEQSWPVEHAVPLAAIFILEQAETDEVIPIGQAEAALHLTRSATEVCNPDSEVYLNLSGHEKRPARSRLFDSACAIASSVPAFMLRVSLTGRFWEEIESTLSRLPATVNGNDQAVSASSG